MRNIRFDDLYGLKEVISDEFSDWGPEVEVSQEMIQEFADITGDQQWIHVDVEKASKGPFGSPIAHGLLTIALMPTVEPQLGFEIVGQGSCINYGCEDFRFLATVPSGSKIHAHSRIVGVREHNFGILVSQQMHIHVVGSERPSLVYTGLLLYKPAQAC